MASDLTAPMPPTRSDLRLRVVSGLVLGIVALGLSFEGGGPFVIFWTAAAIIAGIEWQRLVGGPGLLVRIAAMMLGVLSVPLAWFTGTATLAALGLAVSLGTLALLSAQHRAWTLGGALYAFGLVASVAALRETGPLGRDAVIWLFAIVWSTDVAAYFTGRRFGGPRLLPMISPHKTWSGFAGGLIGAVGAGLLYLALRGYPVGLAHVAVAALLSVASQAGDLFESGVKRRFGAKDSGFLIPGHGGVMDRIDGFVMAAILAALIGVWRAGPFALGEGLLQW